MSLQVPSSSNKDYYSFSKENKVLTPFKNATSNEKINFDRLVNLCFNPPVSVQNTIFKIRKIVKDGFENGVLPSEVKEQIKALKTSIPYVLFSGHCPKHHNDATLDYNGNIQIDFDVKKLGGDLVVIEVKDKLSKLDFIKFCGFSCSGYGVKALIKTSNLDINKHEETAKGLIIKLSNLLNVDSNLFDYLAASQPCFLSLDENVYINKKANTFNHFEALHLFSESERIKEAKQKKELQKRLLEATKKPVHVNTTNDIDVPIIEVLKHLTGEIVKSGVSITDSYKSWFGVACGFAYCGQMAEPLFHSVASLDSSYDYDENVKTFKSALSKTSEQSYRGLLNTCKAALCSDSLISDFYKEYISSNRVQTISVSKPKTAKKQVIYLDNDKFISDYAKNESFDIGISKIGGGTGSGKTRFVGTCLKEKYESIIIVSQYKTTLQNYNKYGFTKYLKSDFDKLKNNRLVDEKSIKYWSVTYKSIKKFLSDVDHKRALFVFDEYQGLQDGVYPQIKSDVKKAYRVLKTVSKTNAVLLMSANNVNFQDEQIKIIKHLEYKKEVKRVVNIYHNANIENLLDTIEQRLKEGKKCLVHTNEREFKDDESINKIAAKINAKFPKHSKLFFNAKNSDFIDLENLGNDITICTNSLLAGKDILNKNIASIIYIQATKIKSFALSHLNQFFGRARHFQSGSFDLIMNFDFDNDNNSFIDEQIMFQNRIRIAKNVIEISVHEIAYRQENYKMFVSKDDNGKMIIDKLAIQQDINNSITNTTLKNSNLLTNFFKSHSYDVNITEAIEIESNIKTDEKAKQCLSKLEKYRNDLANIENKNFDLVNDNCKAFERVEALTAIFEDKEQALKLSKQYDSSLKFKGLTDLFNTQLRINKKINGVFDSSFKKDYEKAFRILKTANTSVDIIHRFSNVKEYNNNRLGAIFDYCKKLNTKNNDEISNTEKRKVLKMIKVFFTYKIIDCKDNNKRVKKYIFSKPSFEFKNISLSKMTKLTKLVDLQ